MRKGDVYRLSLQFPANTLSQIQVGELLERLGSKKSQFIVMVLAEYIDQHPELKNPEKPVQLSIGSAGMTPEQVRAMLIDLLEREGYSRQPPTSEDKCPLPMEGTPSSVVTSDDDIAGMLSSLGAFLQE